jgi:hypothetical protein
MRVRFIHRLVGEAVFFDLEWGGVRVAGLVRNEVCGLTFSPCRLVAMLNYPRGTSPNGLG